MEVLELTEITSLTKKYTCTVPCKNEGTSVEEMKGSDMTYSEFYTNYLMANKPCLIKSISATWNAQMNWVCDNKPNYIYLKRKYGHCEVPVANCKEQYFNAHSKSNMNFKEFLDYWEIYANSSYPSKMPCLYLKDWHFMNEFPEECIYRVPSLFASDWMNEYLVNNPSSNDDYRFVYMGPKGSWTPLHADVFSSFSWSVNICGKKKWIFFPPGTEDSLRDKFGKLVFDVSSKDLLDNSEYPNYHSVNNEIILVQEIGDAIFVPSGWHHQVWNLDDTISINHNWINSCNIKLMWHTLEKAFLDVKKEIDDCKDMDNWEEQCQTLLKCTFVSGNWLIGENHMKFDLLNINPIVKILNSLKLPCINEFIDSLTELSTKIDDVLNKS